MAEYNEHQPKKEKTASGKRLSKIIARDYLNLHHQAQEGAFVIWVAIIVPVEIFYGFDNVVFAVPESHAAMSAGKGVGPGQCAKAEEAGYSPDLCSYARIDLGTAFDGGKGSPTYGLPRPNLLVSNNNNCSLLVKPVAIRCSPQAIKSVNVLRLLSNLPSSYQGLPKYSPPRMCAMAKTNPRSSKLRRLTLNVGSMVAP